MNGTTRLVWCAAGAIGLAALWGAPSASGQQQWFVQLQLGKIKENDKKEWEREQWLPKDDKPHKAKLVFDTGAQMTLLTRAEAKTFTLLKADDADNGFGDGEVKWGGAAGGDHKAHLSKPLEFSTTGLKSDGKEDGVTISLKPLRLMYPQKGETSPNESLLGANFISALYDIGSVIPIMKRNGDLAFAGIKKPSERPAKEGESRTPVKPEDKPAPEGGGKRPVIKDAKTGKGGNTPGVLADFLFSTRSAETLISMSLAAQLDADPIDRVQLAATDPDSYEALYIAGLIENDPGAMFDVVQLTFEMPVTEGPPVVFESMLALVNPYSHVMENMFGSTIFSSRPYSTQLELYDDRPGMIAWIPTPGTLGLLGFAAGIVMVRRRNA